MRRLVSRCLAEPLEHAFTPLRIALLKRFPWQAAAASPVGQDDRSRRRFNAARFRASLVQLRPASRRALGRGV